MSSKKLRRVKGRSVSGRFLAFPAHLLESQEYAALRSYEVKLLVDLFTQFRGANNGDYCAAWKYMRDRGWRSRSTLYKAILGLLGKGFIAKTRQGGLNLCSLYSVTWLAVDDCNGKLDCRSTSVATNEWKKK
jgi:hypothetical protein